MSPQFDGLADSHRLANSGGAATSDSLCPPGETRGGEPLSWAIVLTHRIKKELSICQSSLCLDLVSFPVLSQIKPQAPRLVVPFRQFL